MRLVLRAVLVLSLAAGGVPATPAQEAGSLGNEATTLTLTHDAVTCMVAGQSPLIDASLAPEAAVESGRVYFHSGLGQEFYYVEMQAAGGRYVGTLPPPNADAGPVTYYVEGRGRDSTQTQTAQIPATVVEQESDCRGRLAAFAPAGSPVQVFSLAGTTGLPPGFGGVSSALAAGTGSGAGHFLTSTAGIVLLGVGAVGIATAIALSGDDEPPPVSGSR